MDTVGRTVLQLWLSYSIARCIDAFYHRGNIIKSSSDIVQVCWTEN